jgi:hypothetical protein
MARPNPLVIACLGIGVLVLGVEITAIYRSHHHPPVATHEGEPREPELAAPPPPAAPLPVQAGPAPATPPPAPPIELAAAGPAGEVPTRLPQFTSPDVETVIRTVDEEVFEQLAIPDATREAIRRLNLEHQLKLHLLRAGDGRVTSEQRLDGNDANVITFKQTRREALQEILGPDTEIRFERAERAATKRLRNRLRAQALGGDVSPSAAPPSPQ